jgi:AcrR family transcriptional regulator
MSDQQRGLIWARPERAAKGPAPSTSREQIAAVAVALADAEGMEAVSTRKVAAALQIGTTSLYSYIGSKDELYDLMVDWVEGEDGPPPALSGDWRTDLARLAHRVRSSILQHPWMGGVTAGRPNFGPNSLAWTEHGLAAMDGLGLSVDDLLIASEILQAFVRGFAARELAEQQALQRAGLTAEEWGRVLGPYIESVVESGDYPRFADIVRDAAVPHADNRQDLIFTQGLERVLDGLLPATRNLP